MDTISGPITNNSSDDLPPPQITTSINQLRRFSTALSAFISNYDELHNHLNFINSSINSELPHHLIETANPNLPAISLLEAFCDQTITASPEVIVSEQNPKESVSDCERSHEEESVSLKKPEIVDVSKNIDEIVVSENPVEIDASKKLEIADVSKNHEEIDVSENTVDIDASKKPEIVDVSKYHEEIVVFENHEETHASKKLEIVDVSKKHEGIVISENNASKKLEEFNGLSRCNKLEETVIEIAVTEAVVSEQNCSGMAADCERGYENTDILSKPEQTDTCKNPEEFDLQKKSKDIDVETDSSKKPEEIGSETLCDDPVAEAIVSEQRPNGIAGSCEQRRENVSSPESLVEISESRKPEQTDILNTPEQTDICKNPEEIDVLQMPAEPDTLKTCEEVDIQKQVEEIDVSNNHVETDSSKKAEETVPESLCDDQTIIVVAEAIVSQQRPNGMDASCKQSHENVMTPESLEETDVSKKPEQTDICKSREEIDVLQKHEDIYTSLNPKDTDILNKHGKTGASKKDKEFGTPGRFVMRLQHRCTKMKSKGMRSLVAKHFSETASFREEIVKALKLAEDPAKLVLNSIGSFFEQDSRDRERKAVVLILECFVMISSDGFEIAKSDREYAAEAAVDWSKRMIKEGGFGHMDEVDARGLLLLISGFGIRDDAFKIQDIVDLIRASNVKGISTALRRSVFLIPKIPVVVNLMVKNNLEIEAVDIAYTFGLEDMCSPRTILTTCVHDKIKDIQNDSPSQMLDAKQQQLCYLKSIRQCLESHNVDPLVLLPDIEINEKIQNLEKEVKEWKTTQKRKSLENRIHQEAKRACFGHEDVSNKPEQTDICKSLTVPESSCDQTTPAVPEAIVSEQNPNRMAANCNQSHEHEETDVSKNPAGINVSKKLEQTYVLNEPEEIDILKEPEPTDNCKNLEEINKSKKPAATDTLKKPAVIGTSRKSVISVLESSCRSMRSKEMKWHIATHFSEMINLREEIAKALKLAKSPAKLVLSSIGRLFVQDTNTNCNPHQNNKQNLRRMSAVLILECFVMISGDGIEIAKRDQEFAAKVAVDWKKRMIKEGGIGHTDEVDARGLLLFISGFGFQEHVFTVQDIMDLIRASNVKGISTALRHSVFLIPKIPKVIYWMVQSNLEMEAVDLAYTFQMEEMCHHRNILTTYLNNKIKEFQNSSSINMLEAVKQHLFELKSVKQCLESHKVDPSTLLPDFKINEKIENFEKEVNKGKFIQKRISLENLIHPEAKRACFSHESLPTPESLEEITVSNKLEEIDDAMKAEQTDICKNPEETVVLKKPEELDTLIISEEIDTSKKPEETVLEGCCVQTTTIVPEQNPNRMATNCEQNHKVILKTPAVIDISKKPEQRNIVKKPEQTVIGKNPGEIDTSKKSVVSKLQLLCQRMRHKELKWHVADHLSEMDSLRVEIANALRLAEDPANLVINSIGRFFVQKRRTFLKGLSPEHEKQNLERKAAVLILECFVMISSDDGIEIQKRDQESAAKAAVDWKKRMIKEGGLGHADEVDARGLLLLISGFGIQDHVFKIQDIVDLIRVSNVKRISAALSRSVFLIPKIPEVIYLMVKNNLEILAVEIAYTFGLEDKCHPENILTTYMHNALKDSKRFSSLEKLEAVKQQLSDLNSLKQCLESRNIDPSTLLPDFKFNKMMQNLEKEVKKLKSIQKSKSLQDSSRKKAKLACNHHESMQHQQNTVDHYGKNRFNQSTQPSTGFDSDRNRGNTHLTNHPVSSVYNASAMPGMILVPVPNGQAGGFPGSYDQTMHTANVQPYGMAGPYAQHYLTHGQAYASQPYHGAWGRGQLASSPGLPVRPGPSSGLYGFADLVEKESRHSRS